MSSVLGTLAVELTSHTVEFKRGLEEAKEDIEGLNASVLAFTAMSVGAFAALTAEVGVAVHAFDEEVESQMKLTNAFNATGRAANIPELKELAERLQKVTNFSAEATESAQAMLARFDLTGEQVAALTPRLLDMAAAGRDLNTVAMAVGKAMSGDLGALGRVGVVLDDSTKKFLENASAQERLNAILPLLDGKFAGLAEAMGSTASGAAIQLEHSFHSLQATIGGMFETPVAATLRGIGDAIDYTKEALAKIGPEVRGLIVVMTGLFTGLTGVLGIWGALTIAIPKIKDAFEGTKIAEFIGQIWKMRAALFETLAIIMLAVEALGVLKLDMEAVSNPEAFKKKVAAAGITSDDGMLATSGKFLKAGMSEGLDTVLGPFKEMLAKISDSALPEFGAAASSAAGGANKFAMAMDFGGAATVDDMANDLGREMSRSINEFSDWSDNMEDVNALGRDLSKDMADYNQRIERAAHQGVAGVGTTREASNLNDAISAPVHEVARQMENYNSTVGRAGEALEGGFAVLLSKISNGGEHLSAAMQGAAQGFQSGGFIGAIVGLIIGLLSTLDGFKRIIAMLDDGLGRSIAVFSPLMSSLADFVDKIFTLADVFQQIAHQAMFLGPIFEVIGYILKGLGWVLHKFAELIVWIQNGVMELIARFLESLGFDDAARRVRDAKMHLRDEAAADAAKPIDKLGDATKKAGDEMAKYSKQLMNTPSGFKIDLRRYQAAQGAPALGDASASSGVNIYIDSTDPNDTYRKLRRVEQMRRFLDSGTTTRRSPYSTDRRGG